MSYCQEKKYPKVIASVLILLSAFVFIILSSSNEVHAMDVDSDIEFTYDGKIGVPDVPSPPPSPSPSKPISPSKVVPAVGKILSGKLPQTGETISLLIFLVGLVLVVLTIVYWLKRRREDSAKGQA